MYCGKCGSKNSEGSKFCTVCGARLGQPEEPAAAPGAETADKKTKNAYCAADYIAQVNAIKYKPLGGWLAALAYGHLAGAAVLVIQAIATVVGLVAILELYVQYFGYFGFYNVIWGIKALISSLLFIAVSGFGVFCCVKAYQLITSRSAGILRFYELWAAVNAAAYLLITLFGGLKYIFGILGAAAFLAVIEEYFRKSVPVRTYFGS